MRSLLVVLLLICALAFGCTEYSTGLEKSASRADETSAIATLRTIAQAQETYGISNAGNYGTFEQLAEGGFLDPRFNHSSPEFHGYAFTMNVSSSSGPEPGFYSCNADPAATSPHGGRHFYIDSQSHDIRVNATQPATIKDEIVRP
jgi:hypothetical protein